MVDQIIRPADLPNRANPVASEKVPVDNGVSVGGATIQSIVESGRPAASQSEAEAGTNSVKVMTPLTTDQKIEYEIGRSIASKAQGDLAVTAVQPGDLAAVATSGEYNDLSGLPTLGTAAAQDTGFFATSAQGALAESAVQSIVAGTNIAVDSTDARNPVVSYTGAGVADGDKGAIVVSDNGATWELTQASYEKLAKLAAPLRKITSYDHAKHKAFGITDVMPDGRVVCAFREGTNHAASVGIIRVIYSDDGGLTWSAPSTIGTATGDLRNLAGGVTASGLFVIAAEEWVSGTPNQNRVRFYKSTDGETFSEFAPSNAGASFGPMARRVIPYGKIVNRPNGSAYIPVYIMTSSPSSSSEDFDIRIIDTGDDFATITGGTMLYIFDKSVDGPTQTPTETTIVAVSDTQHVAVSRRNAAPGSPNPSSNTPYIFLSGDAGGSWSPITNINALGVGSAPPLLWFHEETDTIYLFWPLRGSEYYQNADITNFGKWSWYYSYITRSALFSGGTWRPQMQLPFDVPVRTVNGDSGYQHIYRSNGSVFMTFYLGSNDTGTDIFVANLSAIMGV